MSDVTVTEKQQEEIKTAIKAFEDNLKESSNASCFYECGKILKTVECMIIKE